MCDKYHVSNIIFTSSCTVYGAAKKLPLDENDTTGRKLMNPYGKSKFFSETILSTVHQYSKVENDESIYVFRHHFISS